MNEPRIVPGGPSTADGTGGAGYDLSDAPFFSDGEPWGDITARLAWQDGQVAFTESPDGSSLDNELLSVQTATEGDSQYLEICSDAGCSEATLESGEGSFSDEPIGWLGDTRLIYQRSTDGEVEIRELIWNGGVASDAQLGTASDPIAPLGRAYPVGAGTLIPGSGSWLLVSGNNASIIDDNPYGDIQLARTSFGEPLIAYVAGGQLVVAEQGAPGTAIATIPFNGVDFDLSPDTQSVVISTGSGLEIWSLGGELLGASDGRISTGSVLWLSGGIVFLDLTNGTIKLVDPALLQMAVAKDEASLPTNVNQRDDSLTTISEQELQALLPTQDMMPKGLDIVEDSTRTQAELVTVLGGSHEAETRLQKWGWIGNIERTFHASNPSALNRDATTSIAVSIHGFSSETAATEALIYYSDSLIGREYKEAEVGAIGDMSRLMIQVQADGGTVVALYVQQGSVVYRIGGFSPAGDPTTDVLNVARNLLG